MHTIPGKPAEAFVKASRLISKPGAAITVRELTLTDFGVRAITSGSEGIRQGPAKRSAPHRH